MVAYEIMDQRLKLKINCKGKGELHECVPCVIVMGADRCLVYWENDKDRQLSGRKEILEGREATFEIPLRSSLLL